MAQKRDLFNELYQNAKADTDAYFEQRAIKNANTPFVPSNVNLGGGSPVSDAPSPFKPSFMNFNKTEVSNNKGNFAINPLKTSFNTDMDSPFKRKEDNLSPLERFDNSAIGKGINKISNSLGEGFLGKKQYAKMQEDMGNSEQYNSNTLGNKYVDKAVDFVGNTVGMFANPSGGGSSLGRAADNIGLMAANKLAPNTGSLTKNLIRGAVDGGTGEILGSIRDDEKFENIPGRALTGAVGGAALMGTGDLIGKGINKLRPKNLTPNADIQVETPVKDDSSNNLNPRKIFSENLTTSNEYKIKPKNNTPFEPFKETSKPTEFIKEDTWSTLPISNRNIKNVGSKKVNAMQYDYAELKPFIQQEAKGVLQAVNRTIPGERYYNYDDYTGEFSVSGVKKQAEPIVEDIQQSIPGITYNKIRKGLNDLIEDNGKENNAIAKKIEMVLDDSLSNGTFDLEGNQFPVNKEYLETKRIISDIEKNGFDVPKNLNDNVSHETFTEVPKGKDKVLAAKKGGYSSDETVFEISEPVMETKEMKYDDRGLPVMDQKVKYSDEMGNKSKPGFKQRMSNLYTSLVDNNNPLKQVNDDVYRDATINKNSGGVATHIKERGLVDQDGIKIGKSFDELMSDLPSNVDDFNQYMLMRHNIDRASQGKPIYPGIDSQMSAKEVENYENMFPGFKEKADEITNWQNTMLKTWGVDSGTVNEELFNNLQEMYPNYIPTNRLFDDTYNVGHGVNNGFSGQTTPIKKATGSERDIQNPYESILQNMNRAVKTTKYNDVTQGFYNDVMNNPGKYEGRVNVLDGAAPQGKNNIVSALVDGNKVNMEVNDDALLKSLLPQEEFDGIVGRAANKYNSLFKSLITQYNPLFTVSNGIRDLQNYLTLSKETNPLKRVGNLASAYGDLGKDLFNKEVPLLEQYRGMGGGGDMLNMKDSASMTRDLFEPKKRSLNPLNPILNVIGKANEFVETAPRYAEFKNTMGRGETPQQALFDSLDVTTNFGRQGDTTRAMDRFVPFLNASVQGVDKIARSLNPRDPKTMLNTIASGTAAIGLPTAAMGMINKDNEDYQMLDNRTKDTNYLIPYGDEGKFAKIPKSRDLGVLFGALPERVSRAMQGEENAFKGFGETVENGLAPVNPLDSSIISPLVNLARNKDFADRPIVPQAMQNIEPQYQYDSTTSEIGKGLGNLLNKSPKQIDYLIDSTTGVIGDLLLPMTTKDKSRGALQKMWDSRFVADPVFSNQASIDFYDNIEKYTQMADTRNMVEGLPSEMLTPEEEVKNFLTKANKEVSGVNKGIRGETDVDKIRAAKLQNLRYMQKINSMIK